MAGQGKINLKMKYMQGQKTYKTKGKKERKKCKNEYGM